MNDVVANVSKQCRAGDIHLWKVIVEMEKSSAKGRSCGLLILLLPLQGSKFLLAGAVIAMLYTEHTG